MTAPALLDVVRGAATQPRRAIPRDAAWTNADWMSVEQTLSVEVAGSESTGERLVRAFERVARRCGENEARGRAARLRGSFLSLHGRHEASLPHYDRAASLLGAAARDGARIGRAAALLRLGRFDEAAASARAAREAARRRGDLVIAAAASMNLGVALTEGGRPRRAIRPLLAAVRGFATAGNALHEGLAGQNLANALVLIERFDEARDHFDEAAEALRRAGLPLESARCLYNRGVLFTATGHLGDALVQLDRAEEELTSAGARDVAALAAVDRGAALLAGGLPKDAIDVLASARRRLGRRTPPGERRRARLLHARALIAVGDGSVASRLLRGVDDDESNELRGRALICSGRNRAALARLDDAARGLVTERPSRAARALALAATVCVRIGDIDGARNRATRARRLADASTVAHAQWAAEAATFVVEDAAGRADDAGRALDRAFARLEHVRRQRSALNETLLAGHEAWFARAVRHTLAHSGARAAHSLVERWRCRALLDVLGGAAPSSTTDTSELRRRIDALESELDGLDRPPLLRGAVRQSQAHAGELLRLERELTRALSLGGGAAAQPTDALERVRAACPRNTLVLSLVTDDDASWALDVARPDDALRLSLGRGELESCAAEWRLQTGRIGLGSAFSQRHRRHIERGLRDVLARIARGLIDPLAERLSNAKRVVFVPESPWHAVPFGALPFGGRPLAAHVSVALAPSVATLSTSVPRGRGAPVVLGVTDERAPRMSDEARRVAHILGPRARSFTGADAASCELERLRDPRCLHVAAHGRFRADAGEQSAVRLHDGWLRAAEWPQFRLRGTTVVLSGCETGLAGARGTELTGLVRGVLAAGARDVVTSLHAVDDGATCRFMERLHRRLASVGEADAALATTQARSARAGRPIWEWAGFSAWTRRLS